MAKKDKNSIEYLLRGELEEKKKTSRKKRKALNYMLVVLAAAVLGYAFYAFFFCTVSFKGNDIEFSEYLYAFFKCIYSFFS